VSNSINTLLVFLIMIAAGVVLAATEILDEKTSKKLTKIVLIVCIPSTMFANVFQYFDPQILKEAGTALLVPLLTVFTGWMIGMLLARILPIKATSRGVFAVCFAFSNTVFVGLPVNQALFGEAASVPALFYFLGNTLMFWTLGAWGIRRDTGVKAPLFSLQSLKALLSPALITLIVSLALLFLRVPIPKFLLQAASKLGAPGTPMAMIIAGGVIWRGVKKGIWRRWEAFVATAGKIAVLPLIAVVFSTLFRIDPFLKQIFIAQAAMPLMSQSTIIAQNYGADDELASATSVITMLSLLITIPVLSAVFGG